MIPFLFLLGSMLLAGCANPNDLVHDGMQPIRSASVDRVDVVGTAADRKFFNDADAHIEVEVRSSDTNVLVVEGRL